MTKPNNNSINTQISNGSNFSYMSTYYFTNAKTSSNKITETRKSQFIIKNRPEIAKLVEIITKRINVIINVAIIDFIFFLSLIIF